MIMMMMKMKIKKIFPMNTVILMNEQIKKFLKKNFKNNTNNVHDVYVFFFVPKWPRSCCCRSFFLSLLLYTHQKKAQFVR